MSGLCGLSGSAIFVFVLLTSREACEGTTIDFITALTTCVVGAFHNTKCNGKRINHIPGRRSADLRYIQVVKIRNSKRNLFI